MDLTNTTDVRAALQLAGIRPKKGLGQHFLVNADSLQAIIDAAEPSASDSVLEVGPGLGVMTRPLTRVAGRVFAVETDHVLAELLTRDAPQNLVVFDQDILTFDLSQLPAGYKVVANIPYYLTSKLLRRLIESDNPPSVMSLLIQREVAERVVAQAGSMSMLALSVQYYGAPTIAAYVPRDHFWPAPDVDSAVLRVQVTGPAFSADRAKLFRLMKAGFSEKRKQLKNALAGGLQLTVPQTAALLETAGLLATARAQELSLSQWETLYHAALSEAYL